MPFFISVLIVLSISLLPCMYSVSVKNCRGIFVRVKIAFVRRLVFSFNFWLVGPGSGRKKEKNANRVTLLATRDSFSVRKFAMQICRDRKKMAIVGGADFSYFSLYFSVMVSRVKKMSKQKGGREFCLTFRWIFLSRSRARKSLGAHSKGGRDFLNIFD